MAILHYRNLLSGPFHLTVRETTLCKQMVVECQVGTILTIDHSHQACQQSSALDIRFNLNEIVINIILSFSSFSLADSMAVNNTLRAEIQMYQNNIKELENLNQMLKDEHQALQLAFASLEEKLRKAQVTPINIFVNYLLYFSNYMEYNRCSLK
jgi:hypothetical protein